MPPILCEGSVGEADAGSDSGDASDTDDADSGFGETEQQEHQGRLRRALATLPEEHRTALTLRYLEGLDYRAIEDQMGLSNGALRGILGRALGTMRKALKPSTLATLE